MFNMFEEEIRNHNSAVREQIFKGFQESDGLLEKAHQVGDIHPNGKWVWTEYAPGKFDWRVLKKEKQMTIDDISQYELNSAIKILQNQNPDSYDGKTRIIGMSDDELKKFRIVAEYFRYGGSLSKSTRERVRKWANLAGEQIAERKRDVAANKKKSREDALKPRITKAIENLHKRISSVPCDIDIKVNGETVEASISPQHVAGVEFTISVTSKEMSYRFPGMVSSNENNRNDSELQEYAKFIGELAKQGKINELVGELRNVVK